ncbi:hypothetical protein [Nostocoides sp. Soil756]|uniref:hypothetical protein n=1 Tax=Nostocoides sp. Soil756 TaxID=1736399 RepID=UPI0006F1E988|nr:hypothetical protein [Tetrasphaera sp. Soil756]KRE63386.1 hypothetical protein ASG78_00245 [Tetrasphaera sp. Soil756]
MSDISIVPVDERDCGWEVNSPRFRVYLHGSGEASTAGWTATYDVIGADVLQVLDWAQAQARDGRTYAVALVYDDAAQEGSTPGFGRGLVWLVGMDGNDQVSEGSASATTQQRMLERRGAPLIVPTGDRMPRGVAPVSPELLAELDAGQQPR